MRAGIGLAVQPAGRRGHGNLSESIVNLLGASAPIPVSDSITARRARRVTALHAEAYRAGCRHLYRPEGPPRGRRGLWTAGWPGSWLRRMAYWLGLTW